MDYKNFKSESFVIKEAENIINKYIRDRELCDIENFYRLKERYERLKIITISMFIISSIGLLLHVILK